MISLTFSVIGSTRASARSMSSFASLLKFSPPSREEVFKKYPKPEGVVREAWLETLETTQPSLTDEIVPLHPSIWSVKPRIDCIQKNVEWQKTYKKVSYIHAKTKHEMPGYPGKKPWPQKGTGRARHRTIRAPQWANGGKCHGPQNPRSGYYMLPLHERVNGLLQTLAVKFAQDDVHIVKDLEIPSNDPQYIEDLIDQRGWGLTTLFVDLNDIMPANITEATDKIDYVNLMPAYGLNVHSMIKHSTLVLTLDALNHIEDRLLFSLHRADKIDANNFNYNYLNTTTSLP